jgi:hypothetical protein
VQVASIELSCSVIRCKARVAWTRWARSGEALIKVQRPSPADTAMPPSVRGLTRASPLQASVDTEQYQHPPHPARRR